MTRERPACARQAREADQRARRAAVVARTSGGEVATQAWLAELERDSARSRSAVLARLEHGDLMGALGLALVMADTARAREQQAEQAPAALLAFPGDAPEA